MCNISEAALSGCYQTPDHGIYFATAGQRVDPSRRSTFVWREKSTYELREKVSLVSYTNWVEGYPDYNLNNEACINLWSKRKYKWNDYPCHSLMCSVCEIDMMRQ